jgi:hypothetical protein
MTFEEALTVEYGETVIHLGRRYAVESVSIAQSAGHHLTFDLHPDGWVGYSVKALENWISRPRPHRLIPV